MERKQNCRHFWGATGSQSRACLMQSLCLYFDLIGSSSESVRWPARTNFGKRQRPKTCEEIKYYCLKKVCSECGRWTTLHKHSHTLEAEWFPRFTQIWVKVFLTQECFFLPVVCRWRLAAVPCGCSVRLLSFVPCCHCGAWTLCPH